MLEVIRNIIDIVDTITLLDGYQCDTIRYDAVD